MKIRKTGIVAHFNYQRGFGFITPIDKSTADIFVHRDKIPDKKVLHKGAIVEFDCVPSPRGLETVEVLNIDNTNAEIPRGFADIDSAGPESEWIEAQIKFFRPEKGYGFVHGGALRRDAFLSTAALCTSDYHGTPQADDHVRVKVRSQGDANLIVSHIERKDW